jgi:putative FmdB family regulatory protein
MPTYEYECPKCGHFDYIQNMTDDPLAVCPTCGSKVKRMIGEGMGVIFKGPGFYVTDNPNYSSKVNTKPVKPKATAAPCGSGQAAHPACAACPAAAG